MDNITLNLIALAVFVVIGGAVFFIVRRKQAASEQEIRKMAEANGWTYETIREPLAWGLRLKSTRWMLESLSVSIGQESDSGSSNIAMSTTWQADQPGSALLVGARTSQADLRGLGEMLVRQVLQAALGPDASSLSEVRSGSLTFQQKYMVWAQNPTDAVQLLTPAIQSALLGWKGSPPLVKRTSTGLVVELRGVHLKKASVILELIKLGENLLVQSL